MLLKLFVLLIFILTGCTSTKQEIFYNNRVSEDSINWEYNKERYLPSTYNSNNNILDSQDGSVQIGRGIDIIRYNY